jgi:uncharacterized protein (DUF488 family)
MGQDLIHSHMRAKSTSKESISTIGYEGLSTDEFIDILHAHGIKALVDVRELPLSRKPGFSKKVLASALEKEDINYIHMRNLGAPREVRHSLKENGNWETYCKQYQLVLDNNEDSLVELKELSSHFRIALLCFERDFSTCHRSLITNRMQQIGLISKVRHLHPQKEKIVVDVSDK